MAKSSMAQARPAIAKFFDHSRTRIFRRRDLSAILRECRRGWQLASGVRLDDFIEHLTSRSHLKSHAFGFPSRAEYFYTWRNVPLLQVLNELKPHAYFTHLTAARLHGITQSLNPEIYLNAEQKPHVRNHASLTQDGIKNAFKNHPRVSNNVAVYEGYRIILLNGMNTNSLGVETVTATIQGEIVRVRATNLERTLIDLTVRPTYSGGVQSVLDCYRQAKGRVRVAKLLSVLKELDYVYPYHQSVGYYLHKAGFPEEDTRALKEMPMAFEFYMDHRIKKQHYVGEWRLNIPAELTESLND